MKLREYYMSRYNYAIVDGVIIWAHDVNCNLMSSREWLIGQHGMTNEQYEETIRGSVYADHVVICKGSNYESVDINTLPSGALCSIVNEAATLFGSSDVEIHNGCFIGEPGTIWEPRSNLGAFQCRQYT